ncbi:unnamed protein product [Nyctereutes procyonoides]|uniref:(raccoon dog) hypothetical protein n=1 Tax=Nyctereutes procyonoides TaxID=34880 RepID=A0A811YSC9_NYCPR|nr:unnamed protein product [Nyctereutes procyonoides]
MSSKTVNKIFLIPVPEGLLSPTTPPPPTLIQCLPSSGCPAELTPFLIALISALSQVFYVSSWLCLAFVESRFNISKGNKNGIGSFDYGIFQIYRHFCCKDYWSHSENICHEDCQDILSPNLLSAISCAKKIVSGAGGMKNWVAWRLHCAGRPLSYWMTGCFLG